MQTDGLSGFFWLYLNYGRYTSSKKKMFLTMVNLFVFSVGAVIVRPPACQHVALQKLTRQSCSAELASMCLDEQFTKGPAGLRFHVQTMPEAE